MRKKKCIHVINSAGAVLMHQSINMGSTEIDIVTHLKLINSKAGASWN